jgi:hypothetical protein
VVGLPFFAEMLTLDWMAIKLRQSRVEALAGNMMIRQRRTIARL